MLRNYLKTSIRNILKNKALSFLNITGLAIGIACASLIFLWVEDEVTFNHNFSKRNQFYKIYENQTYEGKTSTFHATPGPMGLALKKEIPGINNVARAGGLNNQMFALGDKSINEPGSYSDSTLFSMLNLPFVYGQTGNAFREVHALVINQTMSKKFFGDQDPTGKTLRVNNEQDFIITGVFKDLPANSSFQFHWLAPIENIEHSQPWMQEWGANWVNTFVELQFSANVQSINKVLSNYLAVKQKNDNKTVCFLFGMDDWNLRDSFLNGKQDGGKIQYVRLFSIIAWIILLTACINFMNLATAHSEKRAKEIGVRKVMGALKGSLIIQFIGESLIISAVATALSVGLVYLVLPYFNSIVAKDLKVSLLEPGHIIYLFGIALVTGLIAGSYPAIYLSTFKPITVLKGIKIKSGAGTDFIRKSLVVIQFSISMVLMISTIIIYQQIQHIKNRELGYHKSNLIYINIQGKQDEHFSAVYRDLQQSGVVADASLSDYPVLQIWNNTDNYSWQGKDASKNLLITWENVDNHFISTTGLKLMAGRNFYESAKTDSGNVIINEALSKQMGKQGRIGGIVTADGNNYQIVGIIKDFLYNDMYQAAAPLLLYNHPLGTQCLSIRIKPTADLQEALAKIEKVIKINNPAYPVEYKFIDEDFNQLFNAEVLTGKLASVFAVLAVIISCLGLFGLAAYTAERRVREIGIRKVLGASVFSVVGLLSKDFLRLVGISCLISFPVAWWALNNWLQSYSYRTDIYWWVFAISAALTIFIALSTVSLQAIKTAVANPVKSLRTE